MGSLNGGKSSAYLELVETCSKNIHRDKEIGIIALFHDESHLNKYMRDHKCDELTPSYAYPEGMKLPFEPKIVIRDKVKIDPYFDKIKDRSTYARIKKGIWIFYRAIIWPFL